MKITDVVVYEVKPRWIFVKVCTDEGIEGWGEMISGTKTETVVAGAKEMGAYLMGRNPFEIERLWRKCTNLSSEVVQSMVRLYLDLKWHYGISKENIMEFQFMNF